MHAVGAPHVPVASHICALLPEHCVAPGEQVPVHSAPPPASGVVEHTPVHGLGVPHAPPAVQVSTPLAWQCVWFGAHTPVQRAPEHVWFTQGTATAHVPVASHVCTPLPAVHCRAPGEHATHAAGTAAPAPASAPPA